MPHDVSLATGVSPCLDCDLPGNKTVSFPCSQDPAQCQAYSAKLSFQCISYHWSNLFSPLKQVSFQTNKQTNIKHGIFLVGQWLRLHASTARDMGSIPGWGTKSPHAMWHSQIKPNNNKNKQIKNQTKTICSEEGRMRGTGFLGQWNSLCVTLYVIIYVHYTHTIYFYPNP